MNVTGAHGSIAQASVTITVFPNPISIEIISPKANVIENSEIEFVVSIDSTYELDSVVASLNDVEFSMEQSAQSEFTSVIPVSEFPSQEFNLFVTVEDVFGNSRVDSVPIVIDRLPELTITSPTYVAVATPELLLNATCVDDSEGCTISLKQQSNTLFTWEQEVNELFDFSLHLCKQVAFEL